MNASVTWFFVYGLSFVILWELFQYEIFKNEQNKNSIPSLTSYYNATLCEQGYYHYITSCYFKDMQTTASTMTAERLWIIHVEKICTIDILSYMKTQM